VWVARWLCFRIIGELFGRKPAGIIDALAGMANHAAIPLEFSDGQRSVLEKLSRSQTAPQRQVLRAKALLMAADGQANERIACKRNRARCLGYDR